MVSEPWSSLARLACVELELSPQPKVGPVLDPSKPECLIFFNKGKIRGCKLTRSMPVRHDTPLPVYLGGIAHLDCARLHVDGIMLQSTLFDLPPFEGRFLVLELLPCILSVCVPVRGTAEMPT